MANWNFGGSVLKVPDCDQFCHFEREMKQGGCMLTENEKGRKMPRKY